MSFDMKEISKEMKKNIEDVKEKCRKANISKETMVSWGEEIIKGMKLPPLQEEYLLKRNKEWFWEDSEKPESNDQNEKIIFSLISRVQLLEEKLMILQIEVKRTSMTIQRILEGKFSLYD